MKKSILTAIACAVLLSGCGGGSSSNSGKSAVKKNDLLGSLPAIHANFEAAKKADEAEINKLHETGNFEKMAKGAAKIEKEAKERDEKYRADLKAEAAKLAGKDIPFTCSREFVQTMEFEVKSLKFSDEPASITVIFVAKDDFVINTNNVSKYDFANVRALAKDGSVISKSSFVITTYMSVYSKPLSFTKGQSIKDGFTTHLNVGLEPEKWADFASIEFITADEARKN